MKGGKKDYKDPRPSSKRKNSRSGEPVKFKGIQFRSKLEKYCYENLTKNNIKVYYEGTMFVLQEPFEYRGKKVQSITYTPDFVGDEFIIECKGYANDAFPLRWKMFLKYLHSTGSSYDVYLPHTHKEVDEVIKRILEKRESNGIEESTKAVSPRRRKSLFSFLV